MRATVATITEGDEAWRLLDELAAIATSIESHVRANDAARNMRDARLGRMTQEAAERLGPELLERAMVLGLAWSEAKAAAIRAAA